MARHLSPHSLAEYLDVSLPTIWRMVKAGKLPSPNYLTPALPRFDLVAVEAAIKGQSGGVVTDAREIDAMIDNIRPTGRRMKKHGRPAA